MKYIFNTKSMFSKLLLSFTLTIIIVILSLSSLLYINIEQMVLNMVREAKIRDLSQVSYSANYMNDNVKNVAITLFNDPRTTQLMYQRNSGDYIDVAWAVDQIRTLANINNFVYSVNIYNRNTDSIFSTKDVTDNSPSSSFYDKDILARIASLQPRKGALLPIPRKLVIPTGLTNQPDPYINVFSYPVYDMYTKEQGVQGAVIVNVKIDYLQNLVQSLMKRANNQDDIWWIVDEKGISVNQSNNFGFLEDMSGNMFVKEVLHAQGPSGSRIVQSDGKKVLITYVSSEGLGWKFISITPFDVITQKIDHFQRITIVVCVLILVVGAFFAYFFSRRLYSPIRGLVGRVLQQDDSHHSPLPRNMDEMTFINRKYTEAINKTRSLEAKVRGTKARQRNDELYSLIVDEATPKLMEDVFVKYKLGLKIKESYRIVLFKLDMYQAFCRQYSLKDRALFKFAICNSFSEMSHEIAFAECIDMGEEHILVLIQLRDKGKLELLYKVVRDLQIWSAPNLKLSFTAVIGEEQDNMENVGRDYETILSYAKYRFIFGYQSIISKVELEGLNQDRFHVGESQENRLLEMLISGDYDEIKVQFDGIIKEIRNYNYNSITSYLLYLTYSIYNKLLSLETAKFQKLQIDFNSFTRRINELETLEEVKQSFYDLFSIIAEGMKGKLNRRSQLMVESIQNMIANGYTDYGLCLDTIAGELDMSKLYVGKIFREAMGQSVADYITQFRFNKVVELMADSGKKITDILDESGIENKNYFNKLFKTRMGLSLTDYRFRQIAGNKGQGSED